MAQEIRLEAYTFRIRERYSPQENVSYLPLDRFFRGNDFFQFVSDFIHSLNGSYRDDVEHQGLLTLENHSLNIETADRLISGMFLSGNYGYGATLVHRVTHNTRIKDVDEAPMLPFYFLFSVPEGRNVGLVVLSRFGQFGVTTVFRTEFQKFFRLRFENLTIDFGGFISRDLAREYENGQIRKITIKKYQISPDTSDRLGLREYDESLGSIEFTIKAKRGRHFPRFLNRPDPNLRLLEIPQIQAIGFDEFSSIIVESKVGNDRKSFEFGTNFNFLPYYNINSRVTKNSDNHPIFDDIDRVAKEYIGEFIDELL